MQFDYVPIATVFWIVLGCVVFTVIYMSAYGLVHRHRLRKIRIRIHIGGARGKTSVTRYVASILRADGYGVMAKTTGTEPLCIDAAGIERPWRRIGPANITENMWFIGKAVAAGCDAVVLESMAVDPEYLDASERYLFNATDVGLTNVRADHAEVLGREADAMARAMALLTPTRGRLVVTSEADVVPVSRAARKRRSEYIVVDLGKAPPDEANRMLATALCTPYVRQARSVAQGLDNAGRDPGAFFVADYQHRGVRLRFHNGFACNDVASLAGHLEAFCARGAVTFVLNARQDRPERTREFLAFLGKQPRDFALVICGPWRARWAREVGLAERRIVRFAGSGAPALLDMVVGRELPPHLWGICNYKGAGAELAAFFRGKGRRSC